VGVAPRTCTARCQVERCLAPFLSSGGCAHLVWPQLSIFRCTFFLHGAEIPIAG
jgi:hypothetical protein